MGARPRGPRRLGGGPPDRRRAEEGPSGQRKERAPAKRRRQRGGGPGPRRREARPTDRRRANGRPERQREGPQATKAGRGKPDEEETWGRGPVTRRPGGRAHWTAPRDGAEASEGLRVGGAGGGEEATPQQPRCTPPPRLQSGRQTPPRSPGACRGRTTS